ncbi:hypothetical protein [Rhizobium laguerreae]|uniref:hypothetical protein n=1 Tax=Rhizobium laguerreae TaxID=1076926 RepID=UPI001C924E4E|nr:hypothetical protein [Rhizobium laguerreae]MBY3441767.1 hypothetical protein [Rhizobium laguerreae]
MIIFIATENIVQLALVQWMSVLLIEKCGASAQWSGANGVGEGRCAVALTRFAEFDKALSLSAMTTWHDALLPESLSRDSIIPEAIRSG